uniref:uncharacterized protein LOC120342652 n=1 Tax=Styela clava TaxID=7725 RepID=UPI001939ED8F|nr:uncharacterized protein LOC120342652 [Styela clava]
MVLFKTDLTSMGVKMSRLPRQVFLGIVTLMLICLFLVTGILWLSVSHKHEIDELKNSHADKIQSFRQQFNSQINHFAAEYKNKDALKINQHKKEVGMVRDQHQQELNRIISSIQQQLDDLKDLSKAYWDQHALVDD